MITRVEFKTRMDKFNTCAHDSGGTRVKKRNEDGKLQWVKWICGKCFGWYDDGTKIFGVYCGEIE